MTIDDLRRILIIAGGETDAALTGDILDVPFEDLGYDSLALIESAARIKQEFGVVIPDDAIVGLKTPRALLDLVHAATVEAV